MAVSLAKLLHSLSNNKKRDKKNGQDISLSGERGAGGGGGEGGALRGGEEEEEARGKDFPTVIV